MQSFFLAAQERGFYVLNDVFRYSCTTRLTACSLTLARILLDRQAGSTYFGRGSDACRLPGWQRTAWPWQGCL